MVVTSPSKSQRTLEVLSVNKAGSIRHETLNGRPFIVAPLSLIRPGVLNGSKGPLMYPADELAKSPQDWNGMPILLDHPYKDGYPVSGRSPDIFAKQGLGYVYHARFQGKLVAEGWFDVELCKRNAPKVLANLEAGKPLELSTGLFTTNVPAEGTYNGKGYKYEARNYKPDHLAVFVDKIGACSLADGCGVLVNQRTGEVAIRNKDGTIWKDEGCGCEACTAKRKKKKRMERKIGRRAQEAMDDEMEQNEATQLLNALIEEGVLVIRKRKGQKPSAKLDMTPEKACQILRDGYVNGEPLTEAQKGMFGALCGKRKKKRTNNSLTDNAASILSFDDRRQQLRRALKNRFGFRCHIVDVYDNSVIYMRDEPSPTEYDGPRLFQVNYTASKAGVKLSDDEPVEVQRITSYEPVTNEDQEVTSEQIEELAEMFGIDDEELISNAKKYFGLIDNDEEEEEIFNEDDEELDEEDESDEDEITDNRELSWVGWIENFASMIGVDDPELIENAKKAAKKGENCPAG